MKKICMIVPDRMVKGGIAAVVNGYRNSELEKKYSIIYVESYRDGNRMQKLCKAMRAYIHFIWIMIKEKPDIIHIHSSFGPSFYRKIPFVLIGDLLNKPIINHIHGADFNEFYLEASKKKKRLIKWIYNKCSILIALSDEWKIRLEMIVPERKIIIIENYSILHEDILKERLSRQSGYEVLFLGEIGKRKGCYDIPKVVESVSERLPSIKFILGGAGDIIEIQQILKEKGLENYVEFPGWVRGESKDYLLRKADVFFLPSYNEGMPMAILDAMGYGLPIVSTDVGGIPKLVHQGVNGYISHPGDCCRFAEHIIRLLDGNSDIKQFQNNSFNIVRENYSIHRHINLLSKCYEMIS